MESADELVARAAGELDAGRIETAQDLARRAIAADPNSAAAVRILALALARAGRWDRAGLVTERLVELLPDDATAHHQHGDAAAWTRDWPVAEAALRRAVALDPTLAGAWARLANVFRAQNKLEEAIEANQRAAAAIDPNGADSADVLSNLSDAYIAAGRPDEAIAPLERVLAMQPDHAFARLNLGCAWMRQDRTADAIAAFEAVLARVPDFAQAHFYLALALLKTGDFARGWLEFEYRFALAPNSRASRIRQTIPQWTGEPLEGKTILLYAEQGFGDTIQFARYIPLVAARKPARCIIAVQETLHGLLATSNRCCESMDITWPPPKADLCCPFMSLPLAFGTTLATIPSSGNYLSRLRGNRERWYPKVEKVRGLKVGLAWAGSRTNTLDRYRSCRLEQLSPILDVGAGADANVTFFSLQKGEGREDLHRGSPPLAARVIDMTSDVRNWSDTAGLVDTLDLIIAVDTGIVHLAGAMGKPVWTMVSRASEWRWLQDRNDSPWYPTMRLFRQETLHDWRGLAERVAEALRREVRARA